MAQLQHDVLSGAMDNYGDPYAPSTVEKILSAWKVKRRHLLNPNASGLAAKPSNDSGPRYLIEIERDTWYFCSFAGINGPPRYRRDNRTYRATTPEEAHRLYTLRHLQNDQQYVDEQLAILQLHRAQLHEKIIAVLKQLGQSADKPDYVATMTKLAEQALEVQNASNPIAVATHFGTAVLSLRDRLTLDGKPCDSAAIANHPVYRLWANKIHSIAGMEVETATRFSRAYDQLLLMQLGLPENGDPQHGS